MTLPDDVPRAPRPPRRSRRRAPWGAWSLRLRLTLASAVLFGLALALGATVLSSIVSASRVAALDEVLRASTTTLARLATSDQLPEVLPVTEPGEVAQLLDADGLVLATSANGSRTLPLVPADVLGALTAELETGAGPDDPAPGAATPAQARTTTDRSAYAGGLARVAVAATTWEGEPAWAVSSLPLREVEGVVGALKISLVVVVPLLTLALGALVWTVLGRALRPVEELRRGAEAVTERGGPGSLPVPSSDDELAALARTLNAMLDRLEDSAQRQRAFVADAAHELRSPVAALRASVEIARAHPGAYTAAELAGDLEHEVLRLHRLVDDLLLLARVGASPPARAEADLRALVDDAVATSLAAAGAGGAAGAAGAAGRAPALPEVLVTGSGSAEVDRVALGRVVGNLLDNALRHAAARVRVTVAATSLVVEDDGPGLDPADHERVFERFTRLDDGRQRDAGGSGLGLAIAREVVREHGGDVTLSRSAAGGLRAEVTLPAPGLAPGTRG